MFRLSSEMVQVEPVSTADDPPANLGFQDEMLDQSDEPEELIVT